MTKKINYPILIISLALSGIIVIGSVYYYKKIYLPKQKELKTNYKKNKKITPIKNKISLPIIPKKKIENKIKTVKKQKVIKQIFDKTMKITNNKLKDKETSLLLKVNINKKFLTKDEIDKKIKQNLEITKHKINELNENINVIENKNKNSLNKLLLTIKKLKVKNNNLKNSIEKLNNSMINNNKNLIKVKDSYINEKELKLYFTENNSKLTEILGNKFNSIDKQIKKLIDKERLLTIKNNIIKLKLPKIKSKLKAEEFNNVKFDYVGFDLLKMNNTTDKIAYITLKGDTDIYSVTMDSIIDNRYKIKDLDNNYLYFENLDDKKLYKLKMLDF